MSTIPRNNYMLPTFQKRTLFKGLYGENDRPSIYTENGARNIYSSYNQMRGELMLKLSIRINKKVIAYRSFHQAIDETLKILKKCCPRLYLNFTRVLQFSSTSPRL